MELLGLVFDVIVFMVFFPFSVAGFCYVYAREAWLMGMEWAENLVMWLEGM